MEALLLAHEFHCHRHLSQLLDTFFSAANELFNKHPSIVAGDTKSPIITLSDLPAATPPSLPLGVGLLRQVVAAGQRCLQEFDKLGVFQGGGGGGGPLHEQSMEFSDVSEGTRASLRLRATTIQQACNSFAKSSMCTDVIQ